jgi:hypothetical protein
MKAREKKRKQRLRTFFLFLFLLFFLFASFATSMIAEALTATAKFCSETFSNCRLQLRLFLTHIFCRDRRKRVILFWCFLNFVFLLVNKGNESLISAFSSKKTEDTKKEEFRLARHNSARRGSNATLIELVKRNSSSTLAQPSFTQQLLKKADSIPLKHKLSVHYVANKKQSMMILHSNLLKSGTQQPLLKASEPQSGLPVRTSEDDSENHVRFVEPLVPSPDNSMNLPSQYSKNQVVPSEAADNLPPASPGSSRKSFKGFGMFTEFKSSIQSIEKSVNSIFLFGNPSLFVR